MNRTRVAAVAVFSGIIVVLLAIIIYVETINSSHSVEVWVVTAPAVSAGHGFTADVVQQIPVKASVGDFAYTTTTPTNGVVFRSTLHKGDIVRDDDIVKSTSVAQIPITAAENVNFTGDNVIDIYTIDATNCLALVGSNVPVVSGSANSLIIQVPRTEEAAWLEITNAGISGKTEPLYVVSATGVQNPIAQLCGPVSLAQLESGAGGSGTTTVTPAPTP